MSENNNITSLLGLQDVIVNNVKEEEKTIYVYISLERKIHKCPCCGCKTNSVHDYRKQLVTDIPYRGKKTVLVYRKRRYVCPKCQKKFYEENTFLPRYHQSTNRLFAYVVHKLRNTRSFTDVAKELSISVSTVIRTFDKVCFPKTDLPAALSIDEFKGNTGNEKYNVILTDPVNHKVLDILPTRKKASLVNYFLSYSRDKRNAVEYFACDMYKPYKEVCRDWMRKATIVVDKYHWIREATWALENVRKRVQKKFSKKYRIYFKHSRKLLLMDSKKLTDEQRIQISLMLSTSADLSTAYYLKEDFYKILKLEERSEAKKRLSNWISWAEETQIPEFKAAITAYHNWFSEILNSFGTTITNGFTEGCNNKIKVLKRNAYGYKNFNRFKKRILFMFS